MTALPVPSKTQATSGKSPSAFPFGHAIVGLAVLTAVWAAVTLGLVRLHAVAARSAAEETGNLARALVENVQRTVDTADQLLLAIRDLYASNPEGFDLPYWAQTRPFLEKIPLDREIEGPDGSVLRSSLDTGATAFPASARLAAVAGAAQQNGGLFVSAPIADPATGALSLLFARRILWHNGTLAGYSVLSMDPAVLARMYYSLSIGHGAVTIAKDDGRILACAPACATLSGAPRAGAQSDAILNLASTDGVNRLYSVRPVGATGLVVLVGLSEQDAFGDFQRDRTLYLAGAGLLTLALLVDNILLFRQRRQTLAVSKALSATLENISQGVAMIDVDGSVPVINRRAGDLLHLPQELAAGLARRRIPPDPADAPPLAPWRDVFLLINARDGTPPPAVREERKLADGTVIEILTHPMADGGVVRTFTDITERKDQEEKLASARDAAEAGLRSRSQFLATISHELRTPINGISGSARLLASMKPTGDAAKYVGNILDGSDNLLRMIDDIFEVMRTDSDQTDGIQSFFNPGKLTRDVLDRFRQRAGTLELTANIDDSVPTKILGNPDRLRRTLFHLIGNAVKFTQAGTITVRLRSEAEAEGKLRLFFEVQDTGVGIAPDKLKDIFNDFSQVDNSGTRSSDGAGLGLPVVRRLVTQMGGTVHVESTVDHGSIFTFDMRAGLSADSEPAAEREVPVANLRILVAEDNPVNRLVVTRVLERLGHTVASVENGREALKAVGEHSYDLVVMDLMMPEMDGLQATKAIRTLSRPACDVPIIALTANVLTEDEASCRAAGMDDYLSKPFTPEQIAQTIRRGIKRRRAAVTARQS